jgi:tetratricopeptide (TPR) repeat protein
MKKLLFPLVLAIHLSSSASGQTYADVERLLEERKFAKAESVLQERVVNNAQDDSAYFFLGQIPIRARDEAKYDSAIEYLKKCVNLKPNTSGYHHWLGRAYGIKARDARIFSALSYVGDVKSSFLKAIELDPKNSAARYDLVTFYLRAPGIVGGSVSKARDVARAEQQYDAGSASLLWAQISIYEKEYDDAFAKLSALNKPADKEMLRNFRDLLTNLGSRFLEEEQPTQAQKVFQQCVSVFPEAARGHSGLGRSLYEQKKLGEAIPHFEKAISLNKESGAQYRLALIYEEKGEKQKAIRYLTEFLDVRKGSKDKTVEEAKDKLAKLNKQ